MLHIYCRIFNVDTISSPRPLIEFRLSTSLIHTSCIAWSLAQKSMMVIRHLNLIFKCQRVLAFLCRQRHRLQCNTQWCDKAKRMRKPFLSHITFVGFCTVCSLIKNVYRVYRVMEYRWKKQKRFCVNQPFSGDIDVYLLQCRIIRMIFLALYYIEAL